MGTYLIRLPDVGEGIAEAELVEWAVKVGDVVREDSVLGAVMTDKATVEIPSPVDGTVAWLAGEPGDRLAIGSDFVRLDVEGEGNRAAAPEPKPVEPAPAEETPAPDKKAEARSEKPQPAEPQQERPAPQSRPAPPAPRGKSSRLRPEGEKPLASPALRKRAREAGIDLRFVHGTGPAGRIGHEDLDAYLARGEALPAGGGGLVADTSVETVKIIGLRRKIAEKMAIAKSRIPHITYVEEIDMTALEELRAALNRDRRADRPKLTILPFLMRAMVRAIAEQPQLNAIFDDEAGVVHRHGGVHMGIATQTPGGLIVPVVRHAEALDLWASASELNRLSEAARAGTASRDELSGSTITITSLGALGGIATTPVINHPEVAIVGVNKMQMRPVWDGTQFVPRRMMNLSSSFDHRVIDGYDAAVFVQRIKALLETPATIFIEG